MSDSKRHKPMIDMNEAAARASQDGTPQFLCEAKMASQLLGFCEFSHLVTFRVVNKLLKGLADEILVNRAIEGLPLKQTFDFTLRPREWSAEMEIHLGWQDVEHSSRDALIETVLDDMEILEDGDEQKTESYREMLRAHGQVDSKDLEHPPCTQTNKPFDYVQVPYAGYMKHGDSRDGGKGGAFLWDSSLTRQQALQLSKRMLTAMVDAEALGLQAYFWTTSEDSNESLKKLLSLKQSLFALIIAGGASMIRHGYSVYKTRDQDFPNAGRSGTLHVVTSSGRHQVEVVFMSDYGG